MKTYQMIRGHSKVKHPFKIAGVTVPGIYDVRQHDSYDTGVEFDLTVLCRNIGLLFRLNTSNLKD